MPDSGLGVSKRINTALGGASVHAHFPNMFGRLQKALDKTRLLTHGLDSPK